MRMTFSILLRIVGGETEITKAIALLNENLSVSSCGSWGVKLFRSFF